MTFTYIGDKRHIAERN